MESKTDEIQEWFDKIDDLLVVIDNKGEIVRVNQGWIDYCANNNLDQKIIQGAEDYLELLNQSSNAEAADTIKEILELEIPEYSTHFHYMDKDGDKLWFEVKIKTVKLDSNEPAGAVIFHTPLKGSGIQSITVETVLESMTDGFYLLDDQLRFNYINEVAEKIIGRKRDEILGLTAHEVFPKLKGSNLEHQLLTALRTKEHMEFDENFSNYDGWSHIKLIPLKNGGLAIYFQNIEQQKKLEEKLTEFAYYDFLTGLPNRRKMTEIAFSLKERKKKFSFFYINLDNLKFINALYNYASGDKVVVSVAERLQSLSDHRCHVGRLEGDEFIVIRESAPGERLEIFAEKLMDLFKDPFMLADFQSAYVTASIGIACIPFDTERLRDLVAFAETAMYEAKKEKGSSYSFYRPKMRSQRERRVLIEKSLMGCLEDSGFYFTVQPQISGGGINLSGIEVLARWKHPVLGELSPLEFIEVAEQSGTIAHLTTHLLHEVLKVIKDWEQLYGWNIKTAINMTPSLLANTVFFEEFFNLLEHYGVCPSLLEVELTEHAEMAYSETTMRNLELCREKGISIAIDDFGTGFSMISYLTQFPINKIKIDRYFIRQIGEDAKSEAVLKSLIHLAQSIECELLAEGVERPEEVLFLKENSCTVFQGYYYDKPLQVKDFERKYLSDLSFSSQK
ncbi:EAL domain-containing protein [Planomicrobium sp. MB-3u-38]|uniref:EAL domain-containing protein n=1 Tax=Planomicrobium sp. MB-3u-38 TaxID=2058318 RepID=UPI000C7D7828|nr:EAL domain-containing protein [Planomicrobium sp. MB-3u-38]PKH10265.1 GGDEF domain-containing protein [Planomicrobium sp. MB-3u-38]